MITSRRKVRGTTTDIQNAARTMRTEMTPAERMWAALRRKQLGGLRFRSQHPVGPFVLDFYCPEHRLAVEVDGGVHDARHEQDDDRTAHLESYGYRVLRFRNEEVLENLPSVLRVILDAASSAP